MGVQGWRRATVVWVVIGSLAGCAMLGQGLTNAIEIRKQREMLARTQGKWLGHVRVWLAALGALSVILGKVLVSLHKQRAAIA